MSSILKVDKIQGSTGSTIEIPAGQTLVNNGSATGFGPLASGIVGVSTFTSSGTWTKATREATLGVTIKHVIVRVQGAGASGAYSASAHTTTGGGGGYAEKLIDVSSISSATITIGSGGAGGTSASGQSGGDSSWSDGTNTVTGGGGVGASSAAPGGSHSGGDWGAQGGYGQGAYIGGNSMLGFITLSGTATGYGGGGAQGLGTASQSGADGIVIVWEIAG